MKRAWQSTPVFLPGDSHRQRSLAVYSPWVYRRQESRPSPRKRNAKKAKWLLEEALQIAVKRREVKAKRKGKIYPFECRVPKNSMER